MPTGRGLAKMTDDEIIERLIQVRGIGRWTAEMLLLFDLGRPDVWPVHDYGVAKASRKSSVRENCRRRNRWTSMGESLRRIVPRWPGIVGARWMTRKRS